MPGRNVSLGEVIQAICRSKIARVRTAIPGRIVRVNTDDTVDVEVLVNDFYWSSDEELGVPTFEEFPIMPRLSVVQPRGGGHVVHVPVQKGDGVWVMFSERSLGEWRDGDGNPANPRDLQRHGDWAVCIPGAFPTTRPLSPTDAAARAAGTVIGKDGAAQQIRIGDTTIDLGSNASSFVALASLVANELTKIQATLASATAAGGGAAVVYGTPYVPGSVAATITKAQ